MHKSPMKLYRQALHDGGLIGDPDQAHLMQHFQRLYKDLLHQPERRSGLSNWLSNRFRNNTEITKGLYVWGGVGRGKTYLVDLFYESLPFSNKLRLHFHRFMELVHHELNALGDIVNPLETVSENLSKKARTICLDEMQVTDITDAMLLGNLFQGLFARGVVLATTSNISPDDLYTGGLQRERFLPAISLLKTYTEVVEMPGDTDYRLRSLEQAEIFHTPLDKAAFECLEKNFHAIVGVSHTTDPIIEINDRDIPVVKWDDGIVWFEFGTICHSPRGKSDYIEIARLFHTVLVANVPLMGNTHSDEARRFIHMVDEFYDRNVKLIMSAAGELDDLYTGKRLEFEFQRTASRLREMQSVEYLARQHLG